jgi:hypothetical protein
MQNFLNLSSPHPPISRRISAEENLGRSKSLRNSRQLILPSAKMLTLGEQIMSPNRSRKSITRKSSGNAPAFLFDLDGTLMDSVYQHVLAWRGLWKNGIELSV